MNEELLNELTNLQDQGLQDLLIMLYIKGSTGSLNNIKIN